jgi:hypothetical protein
MKAITLAAGHYAAAWKTDEVPRPLREVDDLGRRYAILPAEIEVSDRSISNPAKEDLLLELCQCFHPYLMKYLVMIRCGHVPVVGVGKERNHISKDVVPFLIYFLPKGKKFDRITAHTIVRHFHLAFKGMETEEMYDILMEQLVRAINQYDPFYTDKVKRIVEILDDELSERTQFAVIDVTRHLGFDSDRYIRLLCRRGFLTPHEKSGLEEGGTFSGAPAEVC